MRNHCPRVHMRGTEGFLVGWLGLASPVQTSAWVSVLEAVHPRGNGAYVAQLMITLRMCSRLEVGTSLASLLFFSRNDSCHWFSWPVPIRTHGSIKGRHERSFVVDCIPSAELRVGVFKGCKCHGVGRPTDFINRRNLHSVYGIPLALDLGTSIGSSCSRGKSPCAFGKLFAKMLRCRL